MHSHGPEPGWSSAAGLQRVTKMRKVARRRKMQMSPMMTGSGSAFSGDVVMGGTSSVVETRSLRRGGVGEVPLPASSVLIFPAAQEVTERSDTGD